MRSNREWGVRRMRVVFGRARRGFGDEDDVLGQAYE